MKQTITKCQFHDAFRDMDRKDNFSYEGLNALYDYIEQYEEDCNTEVEMDVIAFCCEFSEYESAIECIDVCGYDCNLSDCEDTEEKEETALEYLRDNTQVIEFNGGIIIQDF